MGFEITPEGKQCTTCQRTYYRTYLSPQLKLLRPRYICTLGWHLIKYCQVFHSPSYKSLWTGFIKIVSNVQSNKNFLLYQLGILPPNIELLTIFVISLFLNFKWKPVREASSRIFFFIEIRIIIAAILKMDLCINYNGFLKRR